MTASASHNLSPEQKRKLEIHQLSNQMFASGRDALMSLLQWADGVPFWTLPEADVSNIEEHSDQVHHVFRTLYRFTATAMSEVLAVGGSPGRALSEEFKTQFTLWPEWDLPAVLNVCVILPTEQAAILFELLVEDERWQLAGLLGAGRLSVERIPHVPSTWRLLRIEQLSEPDLSYTTWFNERHATAVLQPILHRVGDVPLSRFDPYTLANLAENAATLDRLCATVEGFWRALLVEGWKVGTSFSFDSLAPAYRPKVVLGRTCQLPNFVELLCELGEFDGDVAGVFKAAAEDPQSGLLDLLGAGRLIVDRNPNLPAHCVFLRISEVDEPRVSFAEWERLRAA